jgi:LemA protein
MVLEWIAVAAIVVVVAVVVYYYNRIIVLDNRIANAWAQIDVQLKKRTDLVPNLIETVKGYVKHERAIFTEVTKARENMMKAGSVEEKAKANNQFAAALKTIFAIAENYPNLKANENFLMLQEELSGIENKVAYSRQFYNDSVLEFNNTITTVPGRWFAGMMGRTQQKPYFEVSEAERKVVKVSF